MNAFLDQSERAARLALVLFVAGAALLGGAIGVSHLHREYFKQAVVVPARLLQHERI